MSAAAARNSPTLQISAAQLALAIVVQVIIIAVAMGGLFQRVAAQERVTAPLAAGDLARLEERTKNMAVDVTWIRDKLERVK